MEWRTLDNEINAFEELANHAHGRLWLDVWRKASEIQDAFRSVRYPTREEREAAWERFCDVRDQANQIAQHERNDRKARSSVWKQNILQLAEGARPVDMPFFPTSRDEMIAMGQQLKEAGQSLSRNKGEMIAEHKSECFERIKEIREIHNAWWDDYKSHMSEKHERWQDALRRNIEKNQKRYRKLAGVLEYKRNRAVELRTKIDNAWNPDWASGAQERLAEIEEDVDDIERKLQDIESWIEEDEDKLDD